MKVLVRCVPTWTRGLVGDVLWLVRVSLWHDGVTDGQHGHELVDDACLLLLKHSHILWVNQQVTQQ